MALNIDLDGFGYLSDSDGLKLSPTIKQQPPVSPNESESSSGISSLDSDDLKVSCDLASCCFFFFPARSFEFVFASMMTFAGRRRKHQLSLRFLYLLLMKIAT